MWGGVFFFVVGDEEGEEVAFAVDGPEGGGEEGEEEEGQADGGALRSGLLDGDGGGLEEGEGGGVFLHLGLG